MFHSVHDAVAGIFMEIEICLRFGWERLQSHCCIVAVTCSCVLFLNRRVRSEVMMFTILLGLVGSAASEGSLGAVINRVHLGGHWLRPFRLNRWLHGFAGRSGQSDKIIDVFALCRRWWRIKTTK